MRRGRIILATAAGVAALASCSSKPKGELMIVVDTDVAAGANFDKFEINITNNNYTASFNEFGSAGLPHNFPATFAIVNDGSLGAPLHLRVYAGLQGAGLTRVGAPLILREVVTTLPTDRVVALRLRLEWACVGNAYDKGGADHYVESRCTEGTTCIAGSCVDWAIDSATLPTYSDAEVFGGGGRSGDGHCFDTLGCFSSGAVESIDVATCSIAKPPGASPQLNVAIASSDGLGICDADVCFVPLDANSPLGWTDAGDRVTLPSGFCRPAPGVARNRLRGAIVSTSCAAKTASVPTCGPWSTIQDAGTADARGPPGLPDVVTIPFEAGTD